MAARRLGVRFYSGMPVTELRKVHGAVRKVVCHEATFEADRVIVCAGYASRKILGTVGIDVPMSNVLIEALVTMSFSSKKYFRSCSAAKSRLIFA